MLQHHPKFPTWHTQCHGNTLFFQLLPYFLCIWALSLGDGDHRGYLGRVQHAAEQAARAWCLVVACPSMCPTPRMALTLPVHSIEGTTSPGLRSDCSALHTPKLPWDLKATHFPWAVQLHVPQTWALQTDVPKVTNATRALCLWQNGAEHDEVCAQNGWHHSCLWTVLPVFPSCGSSRASFLLPPDPATVGFKDLRKVAWRRLCKMPVVNHSPKKTCQGMNGVRRA